MPLCPLVDEGLTKFPGQSGSLSKQAAQQMSSLKIATWLTIETSIEVGLAKQGIASAASRWIAVGRCIVIDVIAE